MAMDMLFAGIDTVGAELALNSTIFSVYFQILFFQTSTVVANLLYHLAKNPSKQEKLREEILEILPNVDSKLTPTSLNSVPYMRACIKESMRLSPVVPGNMRGVGKNLVLQGYQIPKDVSLYILVDDVGLQ